MIRAALRYVAYGDRRAVVAMLRPIYGAENEEAAQRALDVFEERWGAKYPSVGKLWRTRWSEVIPFLAYPREIRRILYTTNIIESVNSQLRKVLKPKGHFPSDDAVRKNLVLGPSTRQGELEAADPLVTSGGVLQDRVRRQIARLSQITQKI